MNHLLQYKNFTDVQTIEDIFQDIIDDYDIEYSNFAYDNEGIFYNIRECVFTPYNKAEFYIWRNNNIGERVGLRDEEKNIIPIIKKNMSRLDALGYTTKLQFSDPFIKVDIVW